MDHCSELHVSALDGSTYNQQQQGEADLNPEGGNASVFGTEDKTSPLCCIQTALQAIVTGNHDVQWRLV